MENLSSLESALSQFGLNFIEVKIYLYLLNKSAQSVSNIANGLGIPRTSVYDNTFRLLEKGLVEKIVKYKTQSFLASSPDMILTIIDKEREKVEKLEETFKQLKTMISQPISFTTNTEVKYYYGQQGLRQVAWNALSAKDEMIGYSSIGRAKIVGATFARRWGEEALERRIKDRVIYINQTEKFSKLNDLNQQYREIYRQARIFPTNELYISGDTTIYDEIFALSYWEQGELVAVEIKNEEFVKSQKSIFEILWKLSKPVSFK